MALTAVAIDKTAVNGTDLNGKVIYTSSGDNAITTIIACNNSGSDITLTLYAVPNGKNAYNNPECTIVSALTIPAGDTVSFDQEKFVLGNNDVICGTASIAYTGTGVSVVVSTLPV